MKVEVAEDTWCSKRWEVQGKWYTMQRTLMHSLLHVGAQCFVRPTTMAVDNVGGHGVPIMGKGARHTQPPFIAQLTISTVMTRQVDRGKCSANQSMLVGAVKEKLQTNVHHWRMIGGLVKTD